MTVENILEVCVFDVRVVRTQVPFFIGYIPFVHLTIQNDTEGRTKYKPSKSYSSQE